MPNMISFINGKVSSISLNESLSAMLRDSSKQIPKKLYAGDYYNLVDLCNPIKLYHDRVSPPVEASIELKKKFEWGNKLHEIAQAWLKTYQDFVITEGTIDGIWVDIPKVRGRVDCKIGDSIFEIKTKEDLPKDIREVIEKYPQDVEQLSFYSVIHPSHDKINYLVFIKDSQPFELKVFKLEVKDFPRLRTLLETRIKLVDDAISSKNPLPLGRCRYFNSECTHKTAKNCNCYKLSPLSTEQLLKSIEISFDEEMTKKLEELRKKYHSTKSFFTTLDILSPRKRQAEEEIPSDKNKQESQNYLNGLVRKLPMKLSTEERVKIIESLQDKRLYAPSRWINSRSANSSESIPFIVKSNMSKSPQMRPNEYYIAELGVIVANYKKTRGIIFIISPNMDNSIQVFEVTYKETDEIRSKTKEIIDELEKTNPDLLSLPPCPSFMNGMGKCPLMEKCNAVEGKGCIR